MGERASVICCCGGGAEHHGEEEEPGVRRKKEQGQGPPRPGWLKLELDRACDWAPWRERTQGSSGPGHSLATSSEEHGEAAGGKGRSALAELRAMGPREEGAMGGPLLLR